MRRAWVLPLLLLSGFSGLAYELLWVRLLTLSLGATTASFSIVLAVFFGGLALGSRWAGSRSVGAKRPLAAYAALEATTGVLGVALYPVLKNLGAVVAGLDPGTGSGGLLLRLIVSALLLLPPTFLMGATLPFISVGTIERDDATGFGNALIYGLNTLGACIGAFCVTFLMLPHLGVFGSTLVTALINLLVAAVAFVMSRRADGDGSPALGAAADTAPVDQRKQLALLSAAFLGGFVATGAQVVWARLFAISLRGTAYGVGSVLVVVLVGIAVGSLLASAISRRAQHLPTVAVGFQTAFLGGLVVFAATVPLMAWVIGTIGNSSFTGTSRHLVELACVFVFLGAPAVAAGAVLPSLVSVAEGSARTAGKRLAQLYSSNTLGCIAGSLATGFVLLPSIGSSATLYLVFLVLGASTVLFAVATCPDRRSVVAATVVMVLVAAAAFPQTDPQMITADPISSDFFSFLRRQQATRARNLSYYEGDVATVTVSGSSDLKGLSLNGLGQGSRARLPPSIAHESVLVATVPWLHAAEHRRGLVVGLGAGGTVDVLLKLGVEHLDVAELERGVIDAVGEIWGDLSPLKDARVAVINGDARHHLLTTSRRAPGAYDFITSMPAHPWVASALFTREFFELARDNLSERGVLSTWFGPAEMPDESIEGLFGAFTSVFPYTITYWVPEAGAFYLVGSKQPLSFDVARAETLVGHPATAGLSRLQTQALFLASRVTGTTSPDHPATATRVSTDDNGLIEFGAQRPRKTGVLSTLTYLPVRALSPALLANVPDREAFALKALENSLGTPGGRLPLVPLDAQTVSRIVSGIDSSMPSLAAYANFRRLLAEGKRPEAIKAIEQIDAPMLAERAAVIIAATEADVASRVKRLEPFASRPDVRALLITLGQPDERPAGLAPGLDDDPIGWLFVAPDQLAEADAARRATVTRGLMQRMAAFEHPSLPLKARALFEQAGWAESASWARTLVLDMERAASSALVRRALDAGAKERYDEALKLLLDASQLAPLREPQVRTLLQTALRLENAAAIQSARAMLLLRGKEPVTVDAMEATMRADNAAEAARRAATTPAAPSTP